MVNETIISEGYDSSDTSYDLSIEDKKQDASNLHIPQEDKSIFRNSDDEEGSDDDEEFKEEVK